MLTKLKLDCAPDVLLFHLLKLKQEGEDLFCTLWVQ